MSRYLNPFRWIYVLIDSRSGEIRYVGQTGNLEARFSEHMKNQHSLEMLEWIVYDLFAQGLEPIMLGIECVPKADAKATERRWVEILSTDHRLLNKKFTGGTK